MQRNVVDSSKVLLLFFIFLFTCGLAKATVVTDTLYINRGDLLTVDNVTLPYLAYNGSAVFNQENKRVVLNQGDTLDLMVVNTDSVTHGFKVKQLTGVEAIIASTDTAYLTIKNPNSGVFIFFDHTDQKYRYMGLGGLLVVKEPGSNASRFFWNIKEHQKEFNDELSIGNSVDWSLYYPTYFTINSNSNPAINADQDARITGSVGDTIMIYMVNTGQSIHSLHFHGYHSEIVYSTLRPDHIGRSKDTFSVNSMEAVVIRLIPDKSGEFPVHDHNLVAVSGGNMYPNGMFLTMLIN